MKLKKKELNKSLIAMLAMKPPPEQPKPVVNDDKDK